VINIGEAMNVLFVCMGNICRSPTAEGVFRAKVEAAGLAGRVHIDSAGTYSGHIGQPPDPRTQQAARARGYDLSMLRARAVVPEDYDRFDLLLAMDDFNRAALLGHAPAGRDDRVQRFLDFALDRPIRELREVPDPYYEGPEAFEHVLDLVEHASEGLLTYVMRQLDARP
jgi:protein-tyrosine phosphatase